MFIVELRKMPPLSNAVNLIPDGQNKRVCEACIADPFLKQDVLHDGRPGVCTYCANSTRVLPLVDLLDLVATGLSHIYADGQEAAQASQRRLEEFGPGPAPKPGSTTSLPGA